VVAPFSDAPSLDIVRSTVLLAGVSAIQFASHQAWAAFGTATEQACKYVPPTAGIAQCQAVSSKVLGSGQYTTAPAVFQVNFEVTASSQAVANSIATGIRQSVAFAADASRPSDFQWFFKNFTATVQGNPTFSSMAATSSQLGYSVVMITSPLSTADKYSAVITWFVICLSLLVGLIGWVAYMENQKIQKGYVDIPVSDHKEAGLAVQDENAR